MNNLLLINLVLLSKQLVKYWLIVPWFFLFFNLVTFSDDWFELVLLKTLDELFIKDLKGLKSLDVVLELFFLELVVFFKQLIGVIRWEFGEILLHTVCVTLKTFEVELLLFLFSQRFWFMMFIWVWLIELDIEDRYLFLLFIDVKIAKAGSLLCFLYSFWLEDLVKISK